jgi:hypothetical protein
MRGYRFICVLSVMLATALVATVCPCSGSALDDYYLNAFGHGVTRAKGLTTGSPLPGFRCGTPLKRGLQRDFKQLSLPTQTTLAKYLSAPVLTSEATYLSPSGHFRVHYATSGSDAPPLTDTNGNGVPEWVESVAAVFEFVYGRYTLVYGYRPAPVVNNAPYDLYLLDLADSEVYGQTTSGAQLATTGFPYAYGSFIELDNDFLNAIYNTYTPLQSLQITASHEYHHAIQFGYNFYYDIWYGEASSTWYEDELYDSINQLYVYLNHWTFNSSLPLDDFNATSAVLDGTGYGRWLFNRFLAERYGTGFVKAVWEALAPLTPEGDADIPMVPLLEELSQRYSSSLSSDYYDFTRRLYLRNWQTHTNDIFRIPAWLPQTTSTSYPVSAGVLPITLNHYAFNLHRFLPDSSSPALLSVTVRSTSGIRATLFRKTTGDTIEEFPFSISSSGSSVTTTFTPDTTSEVMLLVANATNVNSHQYSYSTDGSTATTLEPLSTPASSLPPTTTSTTTTSSSDGGGGGGGCFIATAAYGSDLHPKVQLLRAFRDRFLLSNPPGRLFVRAYYATSPAMASVIAEHQGLRTATRWLLTPLILGVAHPLTAGCLMLMLIGGSTALVWRRKRSELKSKSY